RLKALMEAVFSVPKYCLKICLKLLLNLIKKKQQQSKPETSENCSADLFMLELLTFHSTGFSTGIILCQHNRIIKTNIG
ncbi:TPA: hypothetical protein ACFNMX_002005, partial [Neisseria lactamica]